MAENSLAWRRVPFDSKSLPARLLPRAPSCHLYWGTV